jgi:hypothetical protein
MMGWGGPFKISQNGQGMLTTPNTDLKTGKKDIFFFKNLLLQNQNW